MGSYITLFFKTIVKISSKVFAEKKKENTFAVPIISRYCGVVIC